MVQSAAADVDTYLAELPADRREVLTRLRELCREHLPGFTEGMAWGMPAYFRDGTAEMALASQKQYISVYVMRDDVREAFAERLAGQNMGKSCLRFRTAAAVDFPLVTDLLDATATAP